MERQMKHLIMARWNTHHETTKTVPDPKMMQSMEEHQEIPTEDVAVMPVKGLRKQRRVRYLAAESRRKRKDGTRRIHGSRRKLDVACRKVSRHAKVAWRKMNLIRQIWTEVNCGSRSTFSAAGRRMTRRAKVARCRGHNRKR
jgi:hypothetical protein